MTSQPSVTAALAAVLSAVGKSKKGLKCENNFHQLLS
jgi:hypothetical protein